MSSNNAVKLIKEKYIPSRAASWNVFSTCALLVYIWSLMAFLFELPALIMRGSLDEIIGTASYILAFALIESFSLFLLLLIIAVILPPKWMRDHWSASGSLSAIIVVFWAITIQVQGPIIRNWYLPQLFVLLITANLFTYKFQKLCAVIEHTASRIQVLTNIYIATSIIGIILLVFRNL